MNALAPLALLAIAAVLATLAGRFWRLRALDGVSYRAEVRPTRAFPGDTVRLAFRMANAKRFPVPWVHSRDVVPDTLEVEGGRMLAHHIPRLKQLHQVWSLGPREEVLREYRGRGRQRGRYDIGPAVVTAVNPFGSGEAVREMERRSSLIVYPRLFPLSDIHAEADDPSGLRDRQRWLFADPLRVVGVRPYQAGDPERMVHWPATARTGVLQVRQLTAAVSRATALFLEARTAREAWFGLDRARHEAAVAVAATLARRIARERGSFALYSNGSVRNGPRHLSLAAGSGAGHLRLAMEALAVVTAHTTLPLAALVRAQRLRLAPHVGFVVVAPYVSGALASELAAAGRTREVRLVLIGDVAAPRIPGVRADRVPQAVVERWMEDGEPREEAGP